MKRNYQNNRRYLNWLHSTLINSFVAILLSIILIVFNFARMGLTSFVFGASSLGLLTIVLGILPYFSSSHNGITSVSTFNLLEPIHSMNKNKQTFIDINQRIADLRPQYYLYGSIYLIITIFIAFSFPFYFNQSGTIVVDNHQSIPWYETTLFVLSNAVEIVCAYFVVPISIILLFITKRSYIYNSFNILYTILINVILIALYISVKNQQINLSFIEMNIISFCLLGSKMLFLVLSMIPFQRKYFDWYQKKTRPNIRLINKDNLRAILSQYLVQFSSDIFSIIFIIYASVTIDQTKPQLFHGGDSHGGIGGGDFLPSATFSIYLLLISSSREIVHSIIDAAIPSIAEHISLNNQRIDKHFFHRYQFLTTYITCYAITTFLFTIFFSNSILLEHEHTAHSHIDLNPTLMIGLCFPIFIESITSTYDHLLPVFGKFNKILKINFFKVLVLIIFISILAPSICLTHKDFAINGLFISIIVAWTIANLVSFVWSRMIIGKYINTTDGCGNIFVQTLCSYIYIFIALVSLSPVAIIYQHSINEAIEFLNLGVRLVIIIAIALINFGVCLLNAYIFRRQDVLYYYQAMRKRHWNEPEYNEVEYF